MDKASSIKSMFLYLLGSAVGFVGGIILSNLGCLGGGCSSSVEFILFVLPLGICLFLAYIISVKIFKKKTHSRRTAIQHSLLSAAIFGAMVAVFLLINWIM